MYSSLELCAGAGGQALGLEQAGFDHVALVEIDEAACQTLRFNRPNWNVLRRDIHAFEGYNYLGVDLLAGGVPCPPFSVAGKQLGNLDERDLFPSAIRIARECNPKAILLENVKGILDKKFDSYRQSILNEIESLGYVCHWKLVNASDFGVPQLRPRAVLVALKKEYNPFFIFPLKTEINPETVGQKLLKEMGANGWEKAYEWHLKANKIAPTIVGGSKKHGGADLGPTRSKLSWKNLDVDGHGLSDSAPSKDFIGLPRLTVKMAAILQGFPTDWHFAGKKTPAYRQVGNAFPPPVAKAVGEAIIEAFKKYYDANKQKTRIKSQAAAVLY